MTLIHSFDKLEIYFLAFPAKENLCTVHAKEKGRVSVGVRQAARLKNSKLRSACCFLKTRRHCRYRSFWPLLIPFLVDCEMNFDFYTI